MGGGLPATGRSTVSNTSVPPGLRGFCSRVVDRAPATRHHAMTGCANQCPVGDAGFTRMNTSVATHPGHTRLFVVNNVAHLPEQSQSVLYRRQAPLQIAQGVHDPIR